MLLKTTVFCERSQSLEVNEFEKGPSKQQIENTESQIKIIYPTNTEINGKRVLMKHTCIMTMMDGEIYNSIIDVLAKK
jgi:hypothetical protein